jgi:small subunit ribosomal protein S16
MRGAARGGLQTACLKGQLSAILRCCVFHPADEDRFAGTPVDPSGNSGWKLAGRSSRGRKATRRWQQSTGIERTCNVVVMIRLARVGAPKQPYYRVVVIEKDRARNGRSIEVVGTYNPRTSPASVDLKHDRIAYWRGVGAQLSPIVAKLVEKNPAKAAEPAIA